MAKQIALCWALGFLLASATGVTCAVAHPIKTSTSKRKTPSRAFIIYDRTVRVNVASNGTQTKQVVGSGAWRGANGSSSRLTSIFIDCNSDPHVYQDKTVDLHLAIKQLKSDKPDAFPVIYQDAVIATQKMPRNKAIVVGAVAETADPVVRAAVKRKQSLPATGKPYSVLYFYFQAYTGPT